MDRAVAVAGLAALAAALLVSVSGLFDTEVVAGDSSTNTTVPVTATTATARVYPGGCLVEATNLSEGRGTTLPFELVGAPWLDSRLLARATDRSVARARQKQALSDGSVLV